MPTRTGRKTAAKPKPATKKKTGRPSKFGTIDMDNVRKLATAGWTDEQMADFFKVNPDTWYEWKKVHPEFSEALTDWKFEADNRVERSLYERALGYSHPEDKIFNDSGNAMVVPTIKHYPPDTTACIFWLKNRKKEEWRDRHDHKHEGGDTPIKVEQVTPDYTAALNVIKGVAEG